MPTCTLAERVLDMLCQDKSIHHEPYLNSHTFIKCASYDDDDDDEEEEEDDDDDVDVLIYTRKHIIIPLYIYIHTYILIYVHKKVRQGPGRFRIFLVSNPCAVNPGCFRRLGLRGFEASGLRLGVYDSDPGPLKEESASEFRNAQPFRALDTRQTSRPGRGV